MHIGGCHVEGTEEIINFSEGLLDSYTKIWESFPEKISKVNEKVSRSPNLMHSSPFCNINEK